MRPFINATLNKANNCFCKEHDSFGASIKIVFRLIIVMLNSCKGNESIIHWNFNFCIFTQFFRDFSIQVEWRKQKRLCCCYTLYCVSSFEVPAASACHRQEHWRKRWPFSPSSFKLSEPTLLYPNLLPLNFSIWSMYKFCATCR